MQADVARSLGYLAIALRAQGQNEAALNVTQEAADIYGELAGQRPELYMPERARFLCNLAILMRLTGQHEAAQSLAQQGIDVYRELVAQRPGSFQTELAWSQSVAAYCAGRAS
jgi:hypothetical protein